jgi:spore germination cell wall hydrolase CwlJ-like protein
MFKNRYINVLMIAFIVIVMIVTVASNLIIKELIRKNDEKQRKEDLKVLLRYKPAEDEGMSLVSHDFDMDFNMNTAQFPNNYKKSNSEHNATNQLENIAEGHKKAPAENKSIDNTNKNDSKPVSVALEPSKVELTPQTINFDDYMLLAHLIESEAGGEPYIGKLAVGSVVMNRARVKSVTIRTIIMQKGQFDGINTENFKRTPSIESEKASMQVLQGVNIVTNAYYYANLNLCDPSFAKKDNFVIRFGNHWFFTKDKGTKESDF